MDVDAIRIALREGQRIMYCAERGEVDMGIGANTVYTKVSSSTDHKIYFKPDKFKEFVKMCQVIAEEINK